MISGAEQVIAPADSEIALIAALLDKPVNCIGSGRFAQLDQSRIGANTLRELWESDILAPYTWHDCFTGQPISFADAISLCTFWRDLIVNNKVIAGALGMAFWKQAAVAPLLWRGERDTQFIDRAPADMRDDAVLAIWRSRMDANALRDIERRAIPTAEVEDGFIRSVGLGADCVPPLSIVVDHAGIYFDPAQPSDLETILLQGGFDAETLDRAARLRRIIVEQGISKYAVDSGASQRRCTDRRHILVTGQVEDDRSVQSGGGPVQTNLELLRRARANAPDAYILYKPHPDVEAGHRKGIIRDQIALGLADEIVRDEAIGALIAMVDEVHVNTSLAGFEALLRGRAVTTYGVPFYAGWGLTTDLGSVPTRRNIRRTLDELVAAALLIYPRYLDPDTGLPCPPEVLMERLMRPVQPKQGWLVTLRQGQGRIRYLFNTARHKVFGR
jgi:capsular polysaccharide export protein